MARDSRSGPAIASADSSADLHPSFMHWILPSAGDLFFLALFCLLIFTNLSSRLLGDAGIGWHVRTGQLILSNRRIPHFDPFSSSMNGRPWFAWEWLYDVIVGALASATGLNGVVVFTAFVISLTFWLAFRWLLRHGTNVVLALTLALLATCASMIHFFARPHVLSWLLTFLWFAILDSWERNSVSTASRYKAYPTQNSRTYLWLLPFTMLLWVNLHGGFLIGFVLLAIYWVSALWEWLRAGGHDGFDHLLTKMRAGCRVRNLTLVGMASAAVTLINPYGWRLYSHIYGYLSNRFLMDHIDEFQSPNFHYVAQKCFAGLLLLTLVALAAVRVEVSKVKVSHGLIVLFAVYSGLYASRNIPIASLLLIFVIGARLSEKSGIVSKFYRPHRYFKFAELFQRMQTTELSQRGHIWPIAAIVLACWVVAHEGKLGGSKAIDGQFTSKRFPAAAVDYIEKESLKGPFFSPDYWGGYLIYRLYPQAKVVIDDRHDFYGEIFLRSYLKMMHVEPGWEEFLQQHPANCLVIPKDSALSNILAESKAWRSIYQDNVAIVFVPVNRE